MECKASKEVFQTERRSSSDLEDVEIEPQARHIQKSSL
jgi:hypothetical protein